MRLIAPKAIPRRETPTRIKEVDKIEYPEEGGCLIWCKGEKFPVKKHPWTDETEAMINGISLMKNTISGLAKMIGTKPLRYFLPLLLFFPKRWILKSLLEKTAKIASDFLKPWYLKPEMLSRSMREVYQMGIRVATKQNLINESDSWNCIMTACMILEFSMEYRYRFQDIFGEIDCEAFRKNPKKELLKAFDILISREHSTGLKENWEKIRKILKWIPDGTIKKLTQHMEWDREEIALDENDLYHTLLMLNYDCQGKSFKERILLKRKIDQDYAKGNL